MRLAQEYQSKISGTLDVKIEISMMLRDYG